MTHMYFSARAAYRTAISAAQILVLSVSMVFARKYQHQFVLFETTASQNWLDFIETMCTVSPTICLSCKRSNHPENFRRNTYKTDMHTDSKA